MSLSRRSIFSNTRQKPLFHGVTEIKKDSDFKRTNTQFNKLPPRYFSKQENNFKKNLGDKINQLTEVNEIVTTTGISKFPVATLADHICDLKFNQATVFKDAYAQSSFGQNNAIREIMNVIYRVLRVNQLDNQKIANLALGISKILNEMHEGSLRSHDSLCAFNREVLEKCSPIFSLHHFFAEYSIKRQSRPTSGDSLAIIRDLELDDPKNDDNGGYKI